PVIPLPVGRLRTATACRSHCTREEERFMNDILPFVLLGLAAGVLSGLLGIGGAIIIIPSLVYIFGFPQHRAEGTTLALMVPPIGILAVLPFFKRGLVDVRAAAFICVGF